MTDRELIRKAMELWDTYGESYRALPLRYKDLRRQIKERRLKITNFFLSKENLENYPEIYFLEIDDYEEARFVIAGLKDTDIMVIIQSIEDLEYDYYYTTMRNKVAYLEYAIRHPYDRFHLNLGGVNPDVRRSKGYCKRTRRDG